MLRKNRDVMEAVARVVVVRKDAMKMVVAASAAVALTDVADKTKTRGHAKTRPLKKKAWVR